MLDVVIMPDGTPDSLKIVRGLDPDLDAKAIECVRSWRFRPALKEGKPIPVRVSIVVAFHCKVILAEVADEKRLSWTKHGVSGNVGSLGTASCFAA